jgi:hypothetical protein
MKSGQQIDGQPECASLTSSLPPVNTVTPSRCVFLTVILALVAETVQYIEIKKNQAIRKKE